MTNVSLYTSRPIGPRVLHQSMVTRRQRRRVHPHHRTIRPAGPYLGRTRAAYPAIGQRRLYHPTARCRHGRTLVHRAKARPSAAPESFTQAKPSPVAIRWLAQKLTRNIRDYGWKATFAKALHFLARPIYQSVTYRIYAIHTDQATPPPLDQEFHYQFLTPQDEGAIRQVEAMAEWLQGRVIDKVKEGNLCLVALTPDNRVAAFNLVDLIEADMPLVHLRLPLAPQQAWSEQITTHKDWRRRGLASRLRRRILWELRQRGILWFYGGTLTRNQAALALTRSVGFRELGDIHYQKLARRKRWRYLTLPHEPHRDSPGKSHRADHIPPLQLPFQPPPHRTPTTRPAAVSVLPGRTTA